MTIVCNMICMTFYWYIFRDEDQFQRTHRDYGWGRALHMELVHSVPGAAMLVNSLCTNCILKKDNWKFLTYMTVFYGLFLWIH